MFPLEATIHGLISQHPVLGVSDASVEMSILSILGRSWQMMDASPVTHLNIKEFHWLIIHGK
jgi:hypothetical protein